MDEEKSLVLLASVVVIRSTSFVFSKIMLNTLQPFNLLALRFLLASAVLFIIFRKRIHTFTKGTVISGMILGVLFTSLMAFEMFGLRLIDSGTTSFLENSAIIMVPLFMFLLFNVRASFPEITGIVTAMSGIGIITLSHSTGGSMKGIIFCLMAALMYAFAIIFTQRFSQKEDPLNLGIVQVATMGILSAVIMFMTETPKLPSSPREYIFLAFLSFVSSLLGFTLQPLAQKRVPTNIAAMICALNPLSATLVGAIILREGMDPLKITGCLLIITGILLPKASQYLTGHTAFHPLEKAKKVS